MASALTQELTTDRAEAQAMVDAFVAERQLRSAELANLKPELAASISQAGTDAEAAVGAAAQAQVAAVRQSASKVRSTLRNQATQVRAHVETEYQAASAAVIASSETGRTAARGASTTAAATAGTQEAAQVVRLGGLYTQVEGQFRAAAQTAGAQAVEVGATRAAEYRSHKIYDTDSFLDGYLTDNRCDAQAEAAEKVSAAYRDELGKEGDKQVDALRARRPTDEGSVHHLAEDARASLGSLLTQTLSSIDSAQSQSAENCRSAKTAVLGNISQTLTTAQAGLDRHEAAQVQQITAQAAQRREAVREAAATASATLSNAVDRAVADVDAGLATLVTQLASAGVPDPRSLRDSLLAGGGELDTQLAQLVASLRAQADQAGMSLAQASTQATGTIVEMGTAATAAATETGEAAGGALANAGTQATKGIQDLRRGHDDAVRGAGETHSTAVTSVMDGLSGGFDRMNTNFSAGAAQQVDAVRTGLTNAVSQDLSPAITTEAQKAYDQVQPRWKSVLKWIIIIAIVLVVAIVLGPMVIGAVTGAAAALGAGTAAAGMIGLVVGGALVGAATSAATTVVDNAFAGRALTTGLGTAIAIGALGGALGGAASGLLAGPMQGMTQLARYGAQVAVDTVIDTGINAATGNLSWDNLATGILMSAFVNGVTAHPRVQAFQHAGSSRGFGSGFEVTTGARTRFTGTGGPGSAGAVGIDAAHVNVGDTASPTSPYRGTWDMAGGGHNAAEIRGRAASEGIGSTSLDTDPITGVSVDQFSRPKLNSSGAPILDPSGAPQVKTTNKSLFPETMGRPEIEVAGRTALERSLGGGPQTSNTAPGTNPNGSIKNGKFSAIITTPDGHPIRVEGYYAPAPGGGWEIKSVYPSSNVGAGEVTPVPGSQVSVPGTVVTPPDYDYGDE